MRRSILLSLFVALCVVLSVQASHAGALERRKGGSRRKSPVHHTTTTKKAKGGAKVRTKPKGSTSSPPHSRPQSPTRGRTSSTGKKPATASRPPSRAGSRPPSRAGSRPPSRAGSRPPSRAGSRPPSRAGSRPPSRAGSVSSNHGSTSSRPQSPIGHVFTDENEACKQFKSCATCAESHAQVVDPDAPHDPKGKGKAKVVSAHCGWKLDRNEANAKKGKGSCTNEDQKKNDATRRANAVKLFARIRNHVLEGETKPNPGRHISSSWFKIPAHRQLRTGAKVNTATGLAEVPFGEGRAEMKTMWLDVDGPVEPDPKNFPGLNFRGHFTKDSVTEMCVQAYIYSMKANRGSLTTTEKLSSSSLHRYAVEVPGKGHKLCIELSGASCYPKGITTTSAAPGHTC
ncbi:hypothetical protein EXIGLDRAFT_843152 [Exidia glandulosa HHB12029]|uniref:Uncharacterized protein n=1 Tax=Exidia glandulosa HHB12029 TaxID=1314781 RepID=A0A165CV93_EXIGL|nr:hypothetical protein EXIGLDRAFT_843152 [Exidia glandulosa HHB12029]